MTSFVYTQSWLHRAQQTGTQTCHPHVQYYEGALRQLGKASALAGVGLAATLMLTGIQAHDLFATTG